jgi:magnesium transporter
MAQYLKKAKSEIGLSPTELVFRGQKKVDQIQMGIIDFDENIVEEKTLHSIKEITPYAQRKTVTWFNIYGLHDIELLQEIGEEFDFEKLVLADVLETHARPKIEDYHNMVFVSLKMIQFSEEKKDLTVENLSLIFNDNILISFQEKKGDVFEPVRNRIRNQKRTLRSSRPDYLAFALIDTVVDHYLYVLGLLGERIENIDDILIDHPNDSVIDEIKSFKRKINYIQKGIKPAKEMILALSKLESDFIHKKNRIHFKELVNNINQASDTADSYREMLSDQLNVYHMMISSRLNDIMKFLTIFSVIFIPLTFIAGIYGTNFDVLPELHFEYGYYIMLGCMAVIAIIMLFYFKRKNWL